MTNIFKRLIAKICRCSSPSKTVMKLGHNIFYGFILGQMSSQIESVNYNRPIVLRSVQVDDVPEITEIKNFNEHLETEYVY